MNSWLAHPGNPVITFLAMPGRVVCAIVAVRYFKIVRIFFLTVGAIMANLDFWTTRFVELDTQDFWHGRYRCKFAKVVGDDAVFQEGSTGTAHISARNDLADPTARVLDLSASGT